MTGTARSSRPVTVAIVAVSYVVVMAGTTLPSPLYPTLQRVFGLSTVSATQLFAVYAATVLVGLVLFGSLSDRYGRRSVLWGGIAAATASGVMYAVATTAPVLFVARSLSGVSAALVTGTATAFLVDAARSPKAGAGIASVANAVGLGVGPLLAASVVSALPSLPAAPFAVHAVLCVACAILLAFVHFGNPRLRQRHGWIILPSVPAPARAGFAIALLASPGFAVMGAVTAISAISLTHELHVTNLFAIAAIGSLGFFATAAGQWTGRALRSWWLPAGFGLLVAGVGLLLTATAGLTGVGGVMTGLAVAGVGHGVLFSRGLELGLRRVPEYFRARASAAYWCVAYGLTAVGAVLVGAAGSAWGLSLGMETVYGALLVASLVCLVVALRLYRRYEIMSSHMLT